MAKRVLGVGAAALFLLALVLLPLPDRRWLMGSGRFEKTIKPPNPGRRIDLQKRKGLGDSGFVLETWL